MEGLQTKIPHGQEGACQGLIPLRLWPLSREESGTPQLSQTARSLSSIHFIVTSGQPGGCSSNQIPLRKRDQSLGCPHAMLLLSCKAKSCTWSFRVWRASACALFSRARSCCSLVSRSLSRCSLRLQACSWRWALSRASRAASALLFQSKALPTW